jgi:hypothetical protein
MNGKGLLLVLVDPAPALEEELNDWYDTEHLPERAAVAGFQTAQRFTSLGDGPRYAAIYDLANLDILQGHAYLAVSGGNFSPWTRRVTSRTYPTRMTAEQIGSQQAVTGPCTRLLLLKFQKESDSDLAEIAASVEASLSEQPGILQTRVFTGVEPQPNFIIVIAEFSTVALPPVEMAAFGDCGKRLLLAASYRPYRS